MTRLIAGAGAALALLGCAENAAFEVVLDLPSSRPETLSTGMPGERRWALVQIRKPSSTDFAEEFAAAWSLSDELSPIQLAPPPARTVETISVLSDDLAADVLVRVRFCVDPGCNGFEDQPAPAVWFAIEHPFYIGEITEWSASLPGGEPLIEVIPTIDPMNPMSSACSADCADFDCDPAMSGCDINFVDECEVRGCVSGDFSPSGYCRMSGDMAHFCVGE